MPDHLTEILIENAADAGRDIRPGRAQRADGWTPERIRTFLTVLAQRGVVAEAARAAGMSQKSAYALRNGAKGHAFDRAWQAAVSFARRRPEGLLIARLTGRCVVPIIRKDKLWGLLHRPDSRRTMRTLKRLDRALAASPPEEAMARVTAEEFRAFLETIFDSEDSRRDSGPAVREEVDEA